MLTCQYMKNGKKQFYSTQEVADLLGISRVAVFKKIKSGEIKAEKLGRNYLIKKENLPQILGKELSAKDKELIDQAVAKTVAEYGQTLKLLAQE